ncbi:hypothetical protein NC661_14895 [Aquibacillus koreensis]|uniref:Tetratricopeptide repeat protein n=1 Tax=Aquibacillus koreensis TaxID=279446 RepID=A0A9X4AKR0_9BACI|nr:hypothetical protein [Aquibacillus koreensis]MCT2537311.1 hypothetical protein [Aquibacillus koreensis]MDC3421658.1 hypothetical protein [Aquibacillus koreensis]
MPTTEDLRKEEKIDKVIPFIPEGDFYFSKGVQAFHKKKFDIAIKWIKKAVEMSPNEALYHCQMSIIYTEIGAYHLANQILTKVLSEFDDSYIDCYYLIANNYAHLGLLQDAKKYTKSYLEKSPDGYFKEEATNLLTVLELDEDDDWLFEEEDELLIYQETAFYHLERQEWEQALILLEEMMTIFPNHIAAKHEYSYALFFSGEREEAVTLEEQWLKEEPQSLFSQTNLAIFYYEQKQAELYQKHIASIKNVFPIHEQQKLRVATTLARTGLYREAYDRFMSLSKSELKGHVSYYYWYSLASFHVASEAKALDLWKEGSKRHSILKEKTHPWLHE